MALISGLKDPHLGTCWELDIRIRGPRDSWRDPNLPLLIYGQPTMPLLLPPPSRLTWWGSSVSPCSSSAHHGELAVARHMLVEGVNSDSSCSSCPPISLPQQWKGGETEPLLSLLPHQHRQQQWGWHWQHRWTATAPNSPPVYRRKGAEAGLASLMGSPAAPPLFPTHSRFILLAQVQTTFLWFGDYSPCSVYGCIYFSTNLGLPSPIKECPLSEPGPISGSTNLHKTQVQH